MKSKKEEPNMSGEAVYEEIVATVPTWRRNPDGSITKTQGQPLELLPLLVKHNPTPADEWWEAEWQRPDGSYGVDAARELLSRRHPTRMILFFEFQSFGPMCCDSCLYALELPDGSDLVLWRDDCPNGLALVRLESSQDPALLAELFERFTKSWGIELAQQPLFWSLPTNLSVGEGLDRELVERVLYELVEDPGENDCPTTWSDILQAVEDELHKVPVMVRARRAFKNIPKLNDVAGWTRLVEAQRDEEGTFPERFKRELIRLYVQETITFSECS